MYGFILNMWILKKADEDFIQFQVDKGRITKEEMEFIMATPQTTLR